MFVVVRGILGFEPLAPGREPFIATRDLGQ